MAVDIPNGAVATVQCAFAPNGSIASGLAIVGVCSDPNQLIAQLSQELVFDGLTIANYTTSGPSFSANFSATINILNQSGQDLDDTDLISQLSDAVNATIAQNSCAMGLVSASVTQVTGQATGSNAGSGTVTTPAGQAGANIAAAAAPSVHQCGDPSWGFLQDPVQWLKCLTTGGLQTVGLLTIGLLIGVVLLVVAQKKSPV